MTVAPALAAGDLAVDHALAQVSTGFRFLLDVTPVDAAEHRREYLEGGATEPVFTYRELEDDPDVLATMLAGIDVGAVEDPTLGHLLRAKKRELDLQLEMLRARCTPEFLPLSIELYGGVSPALLARADAVLEQVEPRPGAGNLRLGAVEVAAEMDRELVRYRGTDPDLGLHVDIRPDVTGVMVVGHEVLVGRDVMVRADRLPALIQHEVGTHLLTHVNGSCQPVRVLAAGLAGYEETQEGLAVLAEHLVGGLTASRLRQLAGRVLAVHHLVTGASFTDVHRLLTAAGFPPRTAFTTAMRAFRSGGLTKDAIYLRGLVDLLEHLAGGGDLDLLWVGKLSLQDLPLVADLAERGVLVPPRLLPRYLGDPSAAARLRRLATTVDVTRLIEGTP